MGTNIQFHRGTLIRHGSAVIRIDCMLRSKTAVMSMKDRV
jgi:hypothetical protein